MTNQLVSRGAVHYRGGYQIYCDTRGGWYIVMAGAGGGLVTPAALAGDHRTEEKAKAAVVRHLVAHDREHEIGAIEDDVRDEIWATDSRMAW